jgi:4-hydroxythreonine-4-phosphate dehydrogenase
MGKKLMNDLTKPIIAITMGDPSGIGPEIVLKALLENSVYTLCKPIVIGDAKVLDKYIQMLQLPLIINIINDVQDASFISGAVDVIHIDNVDMNRLRIGENDAMNGIAMLEYTERAVTLAQHGKVHAVIGGPHTKKAVELAGIEFDGYPGYVAKITGTQNEEAFLMLVSGNLRIVNVTLHVSLRNALDMIRKDLVLKAIRAADKAVRNLGIANPRIAVAGLNPHAGEQGMFGMEEIEEINPAIAQAREEGMDVHGSFGSDTMFLEWKQDKYDAYLSMYHDQAHLPIKLLAFDKITAFTVGTSVFFCTVGHGSAPDIAGKGIASPNSLIESICLMSNVIKSN